MRGWIPGKLYWCHPTPNLFSMLKFQRKSHSSSNVLVVSLLSNSWRKAQLVFYVLTPHIVGPAYFNCPFHMRQYLCWIRKKDDFFISLGTKPLMEMEDRIQYLRSYRPNQNRIHLLQISRIRPVNSIRYIKHFSRSIVHNHCFCIFKW
jgi:hypothetical protein